jgi:CCR4-NOT transcriptional complex subunit CAF120
MCPSAKDLVSWAAAFRLSHWEKSRLDEIYTAHLIRTTINDSRNVPSTLTDGRLEGWVRVKTSRDGGVIMGTKWKRLWMCVSAGILRPRHNTWDSPYIAPKKHGISGLFSQDKSTVEANISLYNGQRGKFSKPVFKFKAVTQAFAIYPKQRELSRSPTLIKLEGMCHPEGLLVGADYEYEAQMLLMPDLEGAGIEEMLRWLIGGHVAFAEPF